MKSPNCCLIGHGIEQPQAWPARRIALAGGAGHRRLQRLGAPRGEGGRRSHLVSYFKNLTPETLAEARQLGLQVSVWTPDSPDDLKKTIELKVDAITTNRPDVLKRLLDGR